MKRNVPLRSTTGLTRTAWMKPPTCCGKKRFATEAAAQKALNRIGTTSADEVIPRYAYECAEGWWHLTKQRPWPKKTVRDTGPSKSVRDLVWERDQGRCAACGEGVEGRPHNVHHRRNRGAGGSSDPAINSPANLLLVCGSGTTGCHGWITANPWLALDAGYVVSLNSREDPATVRVLHAVLGPVLLMHNGLVRPADPTDLTEVNDR